MAYTRSPEDRKRQRALTAKIKGASAVEQVLQSVKVASNQWGAPVKGLANQWQGEFTIGTATTSNNPGDTMPKTTPDQRRATTKEVLFDDLETGDSIKNTRGTWRVGEIVRSDDDGERYREITNERGEINHICWYTGRGKLIRSDGWEFVVPTPRAKVDFASVILPDDKKQQIRDTINQVDHHDLIFKDWGFGDVLEKGTAVSMLFYGPPGTGKTLTAQAIADQYDYELKVISTAEIETPEPGGAERNIQQAFRKAGDKTVLLFDECDSLICDRAHVGMILAAQINALLTELEHYKGVVVFTTNRLNALDPAFERRLSLKLEFDMPDQHHRALIWERMFPKKAPLAKDVNFAELAEIEVAGGHIKNVVLTAARMAANQDMDNKKKQITQDILLTALEREIDSRNIFTQAIEEDGPMYGTRMTGKPQVAMERARGKVEVGRG